MYQNLRQDIVYGILPFPVEHDRQVVPFFSPKPFRPCGFANPLSAVFNQIRGHFKWDVAVELVLELYYAHPPEGRLVVVLAKRRKGIEDYEGLPPDVVEMSCLSLGFKSVQIVGSEPFESTIGYLESPFHFVADNHIGALRVGKGELIFPCQKAGFKHSESVFKGFFKTSMSFDLPGEPSP